LDPEDVEYNVSVEDEMEFVAAVASPPAIVMSIDSPTMS